MALNFLADVVKEIDDHLSGIERTVYERQTSFALTGRFFLEEEIWDWNSVMMVKYMLIKVSGMVVHIILKQVILLD